MKVVECGLCHGSVRLDDGMHNITIRAKDDAGHETLYQMNEFFTDSKDPRIKKTYPKSGFAFGLFEVEFDEENPEELWLNYGNDITDWRNYKVNLSNCIMNTDTECAVNVNLSDYHGQEIEYWFNLSDIVGNYDESRLRGLDVDVIPPVLNNDNIIPGENDSFWVQGVGGNSKYIYFTFNVSEENFDEINYIYIDDHNKTKEKRLCSRLKEGVCEKRKRFSIGVHNISVNILDDAGNSLLIKDIIFEVI